MKRANPQGTWPLDQTLGARALVLIEAIATKVVEHDWALMAGVIVGFVLRGVL